MESRPLPASERIAPGLPAALVAALLLASPLGGGSFLHAQGEGEPELGWSFDAELSLVMAAGNAESTTLGAGAGLRRVWERARWRLSAGGLRTRSADVTRRAVGTADDFEVVAESESRLTAESYYTRSRFDRSLSERSFLYGGVSWIRNTFTGVDARWTVVSGAGLAASETERGHFRVDLGATYTVEDPTALELDTDHFAGVQLSWDFRRRLTESTELTSVLVLDENLDDSDDLRGDLTTAVAVSINRVLALRTSLQLLYDAQPSLQEVPLFTSGGEPTGETVLAELEELDSLLTVAVVLSL